MVLVTKPYQISILANVSQVSRVPSVKSNYQHVYLIHVNRVVHALNASFPTTAFAQKGIMVHIAKLASTIVIQIHARIMASVPRIVLHQSNVLAHQGQRVHSVKSLSMYAHQFLV